MGLLYIAASGYPVRGVWVSVCGYLACRAALVVLVVLVWCPTIQRVCGRTIGKLPTIITLAHILLFNNNQMRLWRKNRFLLARYP